MTIAVSTSTRLAVSRWILDTVSMSFGFAQVVSRLWLITVDFRKLQAPLIRAHVCRNRIVCCYFTPVLL
jgi:hypothetical protein